ncbi:PREDICTED: torso-like protein isoform X2 [Nicrophorus vespilloides]|uniref:Torso-like protein isoform X2 n=1 Tax=Nicrophorus vespilloides TaxID=110193 RepID=A0ABM1M1N3_NICVS|nr:PREDICTED: torso-like protein isoform X2 [Nicrophorus vespilloides]
MNIQTLSRVAVAARMCSRALLLVLLTAFVSAADGDKLQVGQSMDIMSRYGYLGITMRVVARNESDTSWIFREPTYDVFANLDPLTVHPRRSAKSGSFNGEFHMEFCDNLRQLKQAYFRDFAFEGLDKPWQAFTTGWSSPETIARHMGINSSFVHGDYCYVLVRLSRFWDNVKLSRLPNNVNLLENMAEEIEKIFVGDVASVLMFTRRVGTHYINSFVTGNSLYQVFVYHKPIYLRIRERLKTRGIKNLSPVELSNFFSPWYAEHIGQIQVASGNKTVKHWATNRLRVHYYIFSYTSLMKIHGDTKLLSDLNGLLQNEALLQLDLRSLTPVFKDPVKREWFNEILDNYLNLLEENS